MKNKETLEETAEKYIKSKATPLQEIYKKTFIEAAKSDAARNYWYDIFQQKNSYSQQEVLNLILKSGKLPFANDAERIEWFEQFSKLKNG